MQGEHDTPLNKNGKELARITARALEDVPFDLAISSPLSRALETARILIGDRKIPVLRDSRIREINWGEWDGIGVRDPKYSSVSGTIRLFYEQPFSFPGAPVNCAVSIVRVNGETSEFIEKETVYYDKSLCRNFYHME